MWEWLPSMFIFNVRWWKRWNCSLLVFNFICWRCFYKASYINLIIAGYTETFYEVYYSCSDTPLCGQGHFCLLIPINIEIWRHNWICIFLFSLRDFESIREFDLQALFNGSVWNWLSIRFSVYRLSLVGLNASLRADRLVGYTWWSVRVTEALSLAWRLKQGWLTLYVGYCK